MAQLLGAGSPGADSREQLREELEAAWMSGDIGAIEKACEEAVSLPSAVWPELSRWRAIVDFMNDGSGALTWLERAHEGHLLRDEAAEARVVARMALTLCLVDIGTMDQVSGWLVRSDVRKAAPTLVVSGNTEAFWSQVGAVAHEVLGGVPLPEAVGSAHWLQAQFGSLSSTLTPNERLIAAQVLVNYHFTRGSYEQFSLLSSVVEQVRPFHEASPLMRARWHHNLGYALYQIGNRDLAEAHWNQALTLGKQHRLAGVQLQTTLALVRLELDVEKLDQAQLLLDDIRPEWGAGRVMQLIALQQMRARVMLMRGQPSGAMALLDEALALSIEARISFPECASCLTDRVQVLIALGRETEATALLGELVSQHHGRDAEVYRCLQTLLQASSMAEAGAACKEALTEALRLAQRLRYSMFFRLLPRFAGELCWLALRHEVEVVFVTEVIRERGLPAPADADGRWPWKVWLRMLGKAELLQDGKLRVDRGKTPHKPIELLRLLCCERGLSLGVQQATTALWPGDAAGATRKNLEMTVQRLRRYLGDDSLVRVSDGVVSCDPMHISADVLQRRRLIERLARFAIRPTAGGSPEALAAEIGCKALLDRIIRLSGDFLPHASSAPWIEYQRNSCRRETVRAATTGATLLSIAGAGAAERGLLRTALRLEPLAEELARRLMQSYLREGLRGDALNVYERLRRELAQQDLTPNVGTHAVWQTLMESGLDGSLPKVDR